MELSQAHVRSLGNLGNGIQGNVAVLNGVKSPDSSFAATTSESIDCKSPLSVDNAKFLENVTHQDDRSCHLHLEERNAKSCHI